MSNLPRGFVMRVIGSHCTAILQWRGWLLVISFHNIAWPTSAEADILLLIICFFTILIYIQCLDQDSLDILVSVGKKDDQMIFCRAFTSSPALLAALRVTLHFSVEFYSI
jgi:hypothetical protein